jgi:HSP20 family molecular chaperone IbpA
MTATKEAVQGKPAARLYTPGADIMERPGEIELIVDMPGVEEKSVEVAIEKGVLTIEGHVVHEKEHEGHTLRHREYGTGDYRRTFRISDELDTEKVTATFKDGTLRLKIQKAGKAAPRKIEIKA